MTIRRHSCVRSGMFAVIAACAAAVQPAGAAEVVVRNDTVDNFSTAFVVGDFDAGERAGARLTSPCTGTIVAVQVIWLSEPASNTQTLHDAITIHADAGTFPVPGTELLFLEGPLMTAGFINEFRYVDEANTIPIEVPVAFNESFFVVFEFGEDTDIAAGGASVVRDVSGCQANRNVLYGNVSPFGVNWYDFCLLIEGDLAIRAVVDCLEPTGACCDTGVCTGDVESGDCQGPGQTFFQGQTCGQVSCPQPTGACCNGTGGCLANQTQPFCEDTLHQIYAGNGTTCAKCTLGACCMPDGSCESLIEIACTGQGGLFEGAGTSCATTDCPQPLGACCLDDICVPNQTEENCTGFPGSWLGMDTICGNPNPCAVCDDGDADQDGDVDLADFAAFSLCFNVSATGPCECLDMNNDSVVNLADLMLLNAAMTGP